MKKGLDDNKRVDFCGQSRNYKQGNDFKVKSQSKYEPDGFIKHASIRSHGGSDEDRFH